ARDEAQLHLVAPVIHVLRSAASPWAALVLRPTVRPKTSALLALSRALSVPVLVPASPDVSLLDVVRAVTEPICQTGLVGFAPDLLVPWLTPPAVGETSAWPSSVQADRGDVL